MFAKGCHGTEVAAGVIQIHWHLMQLFGNKNGFPAKTPHTHSHIMIWSNQVFAELTETKFGSSGISFLSYSYEREELASIDAEGVHAWNILKRFFLLSHLPRF